MVASVALVVALQVPMQANALPSPAGEYENTSSTVILNGPWATSTSSRDSGGNSMMLTSPGYAELNFDERSIRVIARKADFLGIANIYIDGIAVAQIDLYSPTSAFQQEIFAIADLEPGEHTIRIERSGLKNVASSGRGINLDRISVADTTPPTAPRGMLAYPTASGVELSWDTSPEPDMAGYQVWRAEAASGSYELLTSSAIVEPTFLDQTTDRGTQYVYQVSAVDTSGNASARTDGVTVTTAVVDGRYTYGSEAISYSGEWRDALVGTDLSRVASAGVASLTFADRRVVWVGPKYPDGGPSEVRIDGAVVANADQSATTVETGVVLFDSGLLANGVHTVEVEALGGLNSETAVESFVVFDTTPPNAPEWTASQSSAHSVTLSWNAPAGALDVARYLVSRRTADTSAFELIGTVAGGLSFTDTGLREFATYEYEIQAQDAAGNTSIASMSLLATTAAASGRIENTASGMGYIGTWTVSASASDSSGSVSVSTETGASASLNFVGTGVALIARTNGWSGIADVHVDGIKIASVDLYSAVQVYQRQVWQLKGLADGPHTLEVTRSGLKNGSSSGRGINVDAVVITDQTAPPALASAPVVTVDRLGAQVSWIASSASDTESYRVYRRQGTTTTLIDSVPATQLSLLDVGLASGTSYRYHVTSVDSSKNESTFSPGTPAVAAVDPSTEGQRFEDCPPATQSVSTSGQLYAALANAKSGQTIRLQPGTYLGTFDVAVRATSAAPVWICGPRSARIDVGGVGSGYGFRVHDSSFLRLSGFTVTNGQKGVFVRSSDHVVVSDLAIQNIGDEAVHLLGNTTDSWVVHNSISRTGQSTSAYGEGVYIGSDPDNWCTYSACLPDRSDRNTIMNNTIDLVTAEGIEAKAGTTGGTIYGNSVDGQTIVDGDAPVVVKGDHWLVQANLAYATGRNAYRASLSKAAGWGIGNVFVGNQAIVSSAEVAINVQKGVDNTVGCDNTVSAGVPLTNVTCQR